MLVTSHHLFVVVCQYGCLVVEATKNKRVVVWSLIGDMFVLNSIALSSHTVSLEHAFLSFIVCEISTLPSLEAQYVKCKKQAQQLSMSELIRQAAWCTSDGNPGGALCRISAERVQRDLSVSAAC